MDSIDILAVAYVIFCDLNARANKKQMEALKKRREELLQELHSIERQMARLAVEKMGGDEFTCATCGKTGVFQVTVENTRCPHDDPKSPVYKRCRFCSMECAWDHKTAFS